MDEFKDYFDTVDNIQTLKLQEIMQWIIDNYPKLGRRVAWNQPVFTDHGTFIIGFSLAKAHISVAIERVGMKRFEQGFIEDDYSFGKQMFRIGIDQKVDYGLLKDIIDFNIEDKKDCQTFWRK